MTPDTRTPRGELPPVDLRLAVAELLRIHGPRGLARRLNMSRDALLTVAIGARALPGTLALLRERLPHLGGDR
jgi:hypothetical protein